MSWVGCTTVTEMMMIIMMPFVTVVYSPSELSQTQTRWQCAGGHCVEEIETELLATETVA